MTRRFAIGFITGLFIVLVINLTSAHLSSDCGLPAVFGRDSCADDIARAGWPLRFYEQGGFVFHLKFNPLFFIVNLWIGTAFAIVFGWLFSRKKKHLPK